MATAAMSRDTVARHKTTVVMAANLGPAGMNQHLFLQSHLNVTSTTTALMVIAVVCTETAAKP